MHKSTSLPLLRDKVSSYTLHVFFYLLWLVWNFPGLSLTVDLPVCDGSIKTETDFGLHMNRHCKSFIKHVFGLFTYHFQHLRFVYQAIMKQ